MFIPHAHELRTREERQIKGTLCQGYFSAAPRDICRPVLCAFVPLTIFERIDWHAWYFLKVSQTPHFLSPTKIHSRSHAKFCGVHKRSGFYERVGCFRNSKVFLCISYTVMFHRTITVLDIIRCPVKKWLFGDWILSPYSVGTYLVGPNR
jgi:hypothetical protein